MASPDAIDTRILQILGSNGRESWKNIAAEVGLSAPSVLERVRKLERMGLIRRYTVVVDPAEAGCGLLAFVSLRGSGPEYHARLTAQVEAMPEIQECHVTAGDYDYLLKVRCASPEHLTRILQRLRSDDGAKGTYTTMTLATIKETVEVPLEAD